MAQAPATQVAAPFGSVGHTVQEAPHAEALSSRAQVAPQAWNPDEHTNPHLLPSQVACDAPWEGNGHTVHVAPQPVTSPAARQEPLHSWVPVGQEPTQGELLSMQVPRHRILSGGQE